MLPEPKLSHKFVWQDGDVTIEPPEAADVPEDEPEEAAEVDPPVVEIPA